MEVFLAMSGRVCGSHEPVDLVEDLLIDWTAAGNSEQAIGWPDLRIGQSLFFPFP